MFMLLLHDLLV